MDLRWANTSTKKQEVEAKEEVDWLNRNQSPLLSIVPYSSQGQSLGHLKYLAPALCPRHLEQLSVSDLLVQGVLELGAECQFCHCLAMC